MDLQSFAWMYIFTSVCCVPCLLTNMHPPYVILFFFSSPKFCVCPYSCFRVKTFTTKLLICPHPHSLFCLFSLFNVGQFQCTLFILIQAHLHSGVQFSGNKYIEHVELNVFHHLLTNISAPNCVF